MLSKGSRRLCGVKESAVKSEAFFWLFYVPLRPFRDDHWLAYSLLSAVGQVDTS